jgi:Predicted membrane protein (DUF2157)
MRTPTIRRSDGVLPDHLQEHLADWVTNDLLTRGEADRISDYEASHLAPGGIPAVAEIVGYLGAALVLAAGGSVYAQQWDEMGHAVRVAIPAATALLGLIAGVPLVRGVEPTFRRLGALLWLLSVGLVAVSVTVGMVDTSGDVPKSSLFVIGIVSLAYASVLYAFLRNTTTQLALLATVVAAVCGVVVWADPAQPNAALWFVAPLIAIGLAWVAGGAIGVLRPRGTAFVLGSILVLYVPQFMLPTDFAWSTYVVGLTVSVALLAASAWLRSTAVLALSSVALFLYLVSTIMRYLSDTLGAPLALLLSGIALLAVALGTSRLRRFTQTPEVDVDVDA